MKHYELFTGRIGRIDEQPKELSNGNCVVNFSVAETPRVRKADGTWEDGVTIWTDVAIFGDEARNLARSVKPGTFVTVWGDRRAREYIVKDTNEKRTVQSVVADQVAVSITRFNFIEGVGNINYAQERSGQTTTAPQVSEPRQATPPQAVKQAPEEDPFEKEATVTEDDSFDDPFSEDFFGGDKDDPFGLNL